MADYIPTPLISQISLPGDIDVRLKGLIVVVGPNSSGKTSLLRDLHAATSGVPRQLVVAKKIRYSIPPGLETIVDYFIKSQDLEKIIHPNERVTYQRKGHQYGTQEGHGGQWELNDLKGWHQEFLAYAQQKAATGTLPVQAFISNLGVLLSSALFIEQRLALTQNVESFDTWSGIPKSALQSLRLKGDAEARLCNEISNIFRRSIWIDKSGNARLQFLVSDSPNAPSPNEQMDPRLMKQFRGIETEGEGLRSYVAVCMTLLLAQRPLCFIDEPEMCLHPPQAKALGRFIATYGKSESTCTLVATHSSDVLRGMLETNTDITVIRLTREKSLFQARVLEASILRDATRKPFSRSEPILTGLFVDGVVLCESDGDRAVYESALRSLTSSLPDIRFVPVGGTGGFREPRRLYQEIGVPVAIAADFDFLLQPEIDDLLVARTDVPQGAKSLSELIKECRRALLARKPEVCTDEVVSAFEGLTRALKENPVESSSQEQLYLFSTELRQLARKLTPADKLKSLGIAGLEDPLKAHVETLLNQLKTHGIFLVPLGELESWIKDLMKNGPSKRDKGLWATEAAKRIEEHGNGSDDVWNYAKGILNYLKPSH